MPFQLFQKLEDEEIKLIEAKISLLGDLTNPSQETDWVKFLRGEVPKNRLEWKGSLQEAYYFFNQIRINTITGNSIVRIHTKNRGLDWVKINKMISTKYGKIQKESRPRDLNGLTHSSMFIESLTK